MSNQIRVFKLVFLLFVGTSACSRFADQLPPGDADNGGLVLPSGFEAVVVVDSLAGKARQLAVNDNGDIYVKLRFPNDQGGNAALRDTDHDGKADIVELFGNYPSPSRWGYGTGMRIYDGYLYFSTELVVYRNKLTPGQLVPDSELETIVTDDHPHGTHKHIGKPLTFDNEGHLYVPFGAPSNACQDPKRTPGAPGLDPCPQLEKHAGVWRFDANKHGQTQEDGYKFASGIRSVVAMDWNPDDENLYLVMHGRDDLLRLFAQKYSPWESALLPSEEFLKVTDGADFGWPYCYYDQIQEKKVLAPEYGGDGDSIGRCADYEAPIMGFPGHWAPNDILFYQGDQFPDRYKNGAFIAFHGSTNRAPYPQSGYFIAFIPFENGAPTGEWEVFADGFAGVDPIVNVSDAVYRPMGIAMGPDGSLYLAETESGKIWRVMFRGDKAEFGPTQLADMRARKELSHIRTPDEIEDNLDQGQELVGEKIYTVYCATCHQKDGMGDEGRFPPLAKTAWVTGDKEKLIEVVLDGLEGGIEVNGIPYNGVMPQHSFLDDAQISEILTYIRSSFGNEADAVDPSEVKKVRNSLSESKKGATD